MTRFGLIGPGCPRDVRNLGSGVETVWNDEMGVTDISMWMAIVCIYAV